ncbi:MAG: hypothetical protein LH650_00930 [Chloroflexi bacterium]|nr:hypothetical protein [Chloroflexota bacterium]
MAIVRAGQAVLTPVFSSETEDIKTIIHYLGIAQSSVEAIRITGLTKSGISEVLGGHRVATTRQARHIAIVAAVIRRLEDVRQSTTGTRTRGASAIGWLYSARIMTGDGMKSPLEVLSDPGLALEQLDALSR